MTLSPNSRRNTGVTTVGGEALEGPGGHPMHSSSLETASTSGGHDVGAASQRARAAWDRSSRVLRTGLLGRQLVQMT